MTTLQSFSKCWRWNTGTTDTTDIHQTPDGLYLRGQHNGTHYWLLADKAFRTQWVKVWQMAASERIAEKHLVRQAGGWRDAATQTHIPNSHSALDADIGCTAATNTLPINRLALSVGETRDINVLYVPVPSLTPQIARQRYSRHRGGYTYENLTLGFSSRIEVDSSGWVTEYPTVCRLIEGPQ